MIHWTVTQDLYVDDEDREWVSRRMDVHLMVNYCLLLETPEEYLLDLEFRNVEG